MESVIENKTFLISMKAIEQLLSSGLCDDSISIKRSGLEKTKILTSMLDDNSDCISRNSDDLGFYGQDEEIELTMLSPIEDIRLKYRDSTFSVSKKVHLSEERFFDKHTLIYCVTDPNFFDPKLFSTLINTYQWFMSEQELFELLLSRFSPITPENLSHTESIRFEQIQRKIKMKVLIFMKDWFKKYKDLIITVEELQKFFRELIYLIYHSTKADSWVIHHLKVILKELEISSEKKLFRALHNREQQIFKRLQDLSSYQIPKKEGDLIKSIFKDFSQFFEYISSFPDALSRQLCILDYDNFQRVYPNEVIDSNWTKRERHLLSPNIVYISDVFNRLSKMLTFYVLCHPKKKRKMAKRVEEVIFLAKRLIEHRNFNSGYAVYLSLRNVWLKNFLDLNSKKIKISASAKKSYEEIQDIFKVEMRQRHLKELQLKAQFPTIPFLGVYLQSILYICEMEKTFNKDTGQVNYKKFRDIDTIIERILSVRNYPYEFTKTKSLMKLLRVMPNAEELEKQIEAVYFKMLEQK